MTYHMSHTVCTESAIQYGKTRVMLLCHPQGGKQKLGLQPHDYGSPICFSSAIMWHDCSYATSKI